MAKRLIQTVILICQTDTVGKLKSQFNFDEACAGNLGASFYLLQTGSLRISRLSPNPEGCRSDCPRACLVTSIDKSGKNLRSDRGFLELLACNGISANRVCVVILIRRVRIVTENRVEARLLLFVFMVKKEFPKKSITSGCLAICEKMHDERKKLISPSELWLSSFAFLLPQERNSNI